MVPKKIHWCWLSGEPLPEGALECRSSWEKHLPEYEIVLWDLRKAQGLQLPPVFRDAVARKKWAVAADCVRLCAVFSEGGVYLDSDVMVYKPFSDEMLGSDFFTATEDCNGRVDLQAAVFGAAKWHPFLRDCLEFYEGLEGSAYEDVLESRAIAPWIYAQVAYAKYGLQPDKHAKQLLAHGMAVYPHHIFAGWWDQVTAESYLLHVCHGSWRKQNTQELDSKPRLLIGVPTCRGISPETIECLWNLDTSMFGCADLFISRNGYGVARNKNMIATKAIDEGYGYIFTVDDDMMFPPDTLARLLALDAGIASAWAMQLDGTTNICRFDAENKSYACMRRDEIPQGMFLDDAYAIVKADAVGIACALIKADVYRSQGYPYHVYREYPNKTLLSEDLYFCDQLRAYRPGVTIKVDLSLKAGHIKQAIL